MMSFSQRVKGFSLHSAQQHLRRMFMTIQKNLQGLAAASLMLMTAIANAEESSAATTVSGNTQGRLLASNCFQCHGTYGSGGFDSLLGDDDIYDELSEFLNGEEDPDSIMAAHIKGYTQEQLQAIADYLANP
jgi:sulfide dehydrogenase cytochrome subunit